MVHEIAKLILEHAHSPLERDEAIERALYLGMTLTDIEEYLDWLDMMRSQQQRRREADQ
jgi:DNA-binding transcriptional MerR regulator